MIIVEGPDGAGKTTLLQQLSHRYDIDIAPRVVGQDTKDLVDLKQWVEENLMKGFQYTLFDRYRLISEFIYGPTLRREQKPGFTNLSWSWLMLDKFYSLKPVIIYCLPPLDVVINNIMGDPDNVAVLDRIEPIYAAYVHRIALESALGVHPMVWDYTRDGKEDDPLRIFDTRFQYAQSRR